MTPRDVAIVPHTHWDREWYSPFQTFRLRLVDLLDELLPQLETDPSYAHFMLDGQMAVVDDYLAVRPEAEPVLRRLAASGRLGVGPWYVLMDEFLVSAETIVRDLQLGIERAAAFGGAMELGYLPDMFGHVAQMPQVLRQFGFEHTVVWRGVPSAIDRSGFWWEALDGSTVRAEYLPEGYGNGAPVPDDAKLLVRRVADFEAEHGELLVGPILWMDGTDHMPPQPWLGRVVAEANDIQDAYRFAVTPLAEHVAAAPTDGLPHWQGELRSGARANLLMGVASNRVDVRAAAGRAELAIERRAEPLSALLLPSGRWPRALLGEAWLHVVRNAAHDSVCACSVDEVVDAVLHRYAEARQIGEGLARRALDWLALLVPGNGDGRALFNPSARTRSAIVELTVPGEEAPDGTQLLSARPARMTLFEAPDAATAATVALQLEYQQRLTSITLVAAGDEVLLHADREPDGPLITASVRTALREVASRPIDGAVRIDVTHPPTVRVLARAADLPGYGWRVWAPSPLDVDVVRADATTLTNGLVEVVVDPSTGTWSIDGHAGLGRLVDSGDMGDTYNYCPPPDDVVVDTAESVTVRVLEGGPLRARIEIASRYRWSAAGREVDVRTTLELRAGEALVRVRTEFDNQVRDHRVRAVFPLPARAPVSHAGCVFATVERGLEAEGGPTEYGLATYPAQRFVTAGGLTIAAEGVFEYELIDDGSALAITLARCTGLLSQGPMSYRPVPAGPIVAAEGAQLQGPVSVSYAVEVGERNPYAVVEDAFLPFETTRAAGPATGPAEGQALSVSGAEVSAVLREGGSLVVRVFNPTPDPTVVHLDGRAGWLLDLRGRAVAPFEGSFELAPWAIATATFPQGDLAT